VFHAYQAELFPTEARTTGIGFTYAWSRASMAAVSFFLPGVIATSLTATFALTASAFLGVAVLIGLFGPLTNSRSLEAISSGETEGQGRVESLSRDAPAPQSGPLPGT
jgi:putative MFS transporter